jgi:hypothetical protein
MNLQFPKLRKISSLDGQLLTSKENHAFFLLLHECLHLKFITVSSGWLLKWKEESVSYFNELSEHLPSGTEENNEMFQIGKQATGTDAPEYLWVLSLYRSVSEVN